MRELTCLEDHGPAEVHASGETQNQGVAAGQDTDETAEDAESEEDAEANGPAIGADEDGPYETLVRSLRNEINLALQRGHIGNAADRQGIVMFVLDSAHAGNLHEANSSRDNVIQEICFRLESLAPRYELLIPQVAVKLRIMENDLRAMAWHESWERGIQTTPYNV